MITLESIVESIKLQLKPHLNDDVKLYDEFIIRMINDTRAAMIRSLYISGDSLVSFFQEFVVASTVVNSGAGVYMFNQITMPVQLLNGCGRKNIQNISSVSANYEGLDMHYCSYEEFMSYSSHVYGVNSFVVTNVGNRVLFKDTATVKAAKNMLIRAIVETPELVPNYVYETSEYPIGANNLRQLEIVTFQHLAVKLGMPVDVINNGYDETKNANIPRQKEPAKEEQQ